MDKEALRLRRQIRKLSAEIKAGQEAAAVPRFGVPLGATEQVAPSPPMDAGCCKEVMRPTPSKAERRAKLIAAHIALEAVRLDIDANWTHVEETRKGIMTALGRLEVTD